MISFENFDMWFRPIGGACCRFRKMLWASKGVIMQTMMFVVCGMFIWFLAVWFPVMCARLDPYLEYLGIVGLRSLVSIYIWGGQVLPQFLQYIIFGPVISVLAGGCVSCIISATLGIVFESVSVVGQSCLSLVDHFLDLLRLLIVFSTHFGPYYEVRRRGVKFNTVFAFRPVATKSLAAVGAAFQIPITLELLFFQLFYIIFQVTWITFSIPYFVGVTGVNAVHAAVFSSIFIAVNILKFWVNYLTWGGCVITGLGLGLVLIAAVYVRADRVSNFFNRQLLFSFTVPNRWFGSNLAPGLSLSSTPISVGSTWVRLLESIVGRAESLVVSTSALRLDPKQMDLSFW